MPKNNSNTVTSPQYGSESALEIKQEHKEEVKEAPAASTSEKEKVRQLHQAAYEGNTKKISRLLKEGVSINAVSEDAQTPLESALESKTPKAFWYLLQHNAITKTNTASLVVSFSSWEPAEKTEALKALKEKGSTLTYAQEAAYTGDDAKLTDKHLEETDARGLSVIHYAAASGDLKKLQRIAKRALVLAAGRGIEAINEYLNQYNGVLGMYVFYIAAINGHLDIIKWTLSSEGCARKLFEGIREKQSRYNGIRLCTGGYEEANTLAKDIYPLERAIADIAKKEKLNILAYLTHPDVAVVDAESVLERFVSQNNVLIPVSPKERRSIVKSLLRVAAKSIAVENLYRHLNTLIEAVDDLTLVKIMLSIIKGKPDNQSCISSCLSGAAKKGYYSVVKKLLKRIAVEDIREGASYLGEGNLDFALVFAVQGRHLNIVKCVFAIGRGISREAFYKGIEWGVINNDLDTVTFMLTNADHVNMAITGKHLYPSLLRAAQAGFVEVTQCLLANGATLEVPNKPSILEKLLKASDDEEKNIYQLSQRIRLSKMLVGEYGADISFLLDQKSDDSTKKLTTIMSNLACRYKKGGMFVGYIIALNQALRMQMRMQKSAFSGFPHELLLGILQYLNPNKPTLHVTLSKEKGIPGQLVLIDPEEKLKNWLRKSGVQMRPNIFFNAVKGSYVQTFKKEERPRQPESLPYFDAVRGCYHR